MELTIRETLPSEAGELFSVRARTRENRISRDQLAEIGITAESVADGIAQGRIKAWVCLHESDVVGFCNGDRETGEILVLAVLPEYEGLGIGRGLLNRAVEQLRDVGCIELWLAASPDSSTRAHGFYRSLGWRHSGEMDENGDEILVLASYEV